MSRGGMMRQDAEHLQAVFHAAAGANEMAEHHLRTFVMHAVVIFKAAAAPGRRERPTGKTSRHFNHVALSVPSIDAECVELEQLASVVFVQPAAVSSPRKARGKTVWPYRLPVVQIKQHGGALGRG